MVKKSRGAALAMSGSAVLSFTIASAIINILIPYLLTGDIRSIVENPQQLTRTDQIISLIVLIGILLLVLIGMGAYWLQRYFGESYFGWRGAARWILFGTFLAILIKIPAWFLAKQGWLLGYIWLGLSPFLAFFLARWLLPLRK
jgi:hypothetical protein